MNARGERLKIRNALQFIVGQLDAEMIFYARKQAERLQTVNAEFFEEIVAGRELLARNFEILRGQLQDLVRHLLKSWHNFNSKLARRRKLEY